MPILLDRLTPHASASPCFVRAVHEAAVDPVLARRPQHVLSRLRRGEADDGSLRGGEAPAQRRRGG